jgi:serine/threonine-protein kinase RsbW
VTILNYQMANRLDAIDPMVLALKKQIGSALPDEAMCRFDICLSETLQNLVLYAETDQKEDPIDLALGISEGRVVAEIFDPRGAAKFDLRQLAPDLSEIDAMAEHGRGLALIMECADAIDYGLMSERNRLSLTFLARS